MSEIQSRWLSNKAAAAYLDCSESLLNMDRLTGLHGIPFSRLGRHVRYDRFDLDAWLERRKIRAFNEACSN